MMRNSEWRRLRSLVLGVVGLSAVLCLGLLSTGAGWSGNHGGEQLSSRGAQQLRGSVLLQRGDEGMRFRGARTTQLKGLSGLEGAGLFWGDALTTKDEVDENDRMKDWSDDEDKGLQDEAEDALTLCDDVLSGLVRSGHSSSAGHHMYLWSRWPEEGWGKNGWFRNGLGRVEDSHSSVTGGGASGPPRRCVHRAISRHDTRFTNTLAGKNNWNQDHMAITLGKIIDQFKPHTKGILKDGKVVHVPRYDRSSFRGYGGGHQLAEEIESPADMDMYSEEGLAEPEDSRDGPGVLLQTHDLAKKIKKMGLKQLPVRKDQEALKARTGQQSLRQARLQSLQDYTPSMDIGAAAIMENAVVTPQLQEPQGVAPGAYQPVQGQPLTPYIQSSTAGPCTNNQQLSNTADCNKEFYYQPWYDKYPQPIVSSVANIPPPVTIQPATVTRADVQLPSAVVTEATVVDQPWASYSGLPSEQTIVTGCKDGYSKDCKQPPQDGSETYNVKIKAEPKGCGTPGRQTVWDGDLDVKPINCAPEVQTNLMQTLVLHRRAVQLHATGFAVPTATFLEFASPGSVRA